MVRKSKRRLLSLRDTARAMSQENVDVIRRSVEHFNRHGQPDFSLADPDVEWHTLPVSVASDTYRGHDDVRAFFEEWQLDWESVRIEPEDLIDAGADEVVLVGRLQVQGRRSGAEVALPISQLFRFRDGLIISVHAFGTREEALQAVGEEAVSQENVEVVRRAAEAYTAGDVDAWGEILAPNAILLPVEGWPEPGPFAGQEAVVRQFQLQREAWDADALELISDFIDAADRVVVRVIWRGRGHGPESSFEVTGVFTVRKGRILIIEFFWDHAEALEAVGLSEQGAHDPA
jgi:ketosteroid isomerase-like protein